MSTTYQVVALCAAAYKGRSASLDTCLTHLVAIQGDECVSIPCGISVDHIAYDVPMQQPTCKRCAALYTKLTEGS